MLRSIFGTRSFSTLPRNKARILAILNDNTAYKERLAHLRGDWDQELPQATGHIAQMARSVDAEVMRKRAAQDAAASSGEPGGSAPPEAKRATKPKATFTEQSAKIATQPPAPQVLTMAPMMDILMAPTFAPEAAAGAAPPSGPGGPATAKQETAVKNEPTPPDTPPRRRPEANREAAA